MPTLTAAEVDAFLTEPGHLVRLGTVDDGGMPRVVPAWFLADGGRLLFTLRSASVAWHNLQRDPRVGLSIDEEAAPYRKVTVQGSVGVVHPAGDDEVWRDIYLRIAGRYLPVDAAERYVLGTADQPRPLLAVPLVGPGVVVTTWRMPVAGEGPTGIWHRRYYAGGTLLAERANAVPPSRASE